MPTAVVLAAAWACSVAILAPAALMAQNPPRRGDDPAGAARYFREMRLEPGQLRFPARARQVALEQMRTRWPQLRARSDASFTRVPNLDPGRTWVPLGPKPISAFGDVDSGRLNSIAIHPTNPQVMYVGGAQGGVWKTTDGGLNWVPLTDYQCSLAMGSVVLDPVNPEIVYAGTGEQNNSVDSYYGCGVLRSTDGGATWVELGKAEFDRVDGGSTISRVVVDAATAGSATSTTVLVAASNGIFRSTDSGNSWTLASGPGNVVVSDLVADPTNSNVYYAAVGNRNGATANGVWKSTDKGATWVKVSKSPFPTNGVGRINLAIAASSPQTVYASIQNSGTPFGSLLGIYATEDGGTTWAQRAAQSGSALCGGGNQCWYDMVIAVDPSDANIVYFGGVSLFKSTNGAASFVTIGQQIHVDQHAFAFHPGVPTTVYAGNDGGIYKSTNGGSTWASLNHTLELTQFYAGVSVSPTSATTILGGTQDNGTLQWTGVGAWPGVFGGDGGYTAIDQVTGDVAYAETQWDPSFGGPRRRDPGTGTTNFVRRVNGINVSDRAQFIPPLVMDPGRSKVLYFGTFNLYRTGNSADLWTNIGQSLVAAGGTITAIAPAPTDSLTIYVGSSDGRLSYTHDLGVTWNTGSGPTGFITDIAVDSRDALHAIAVRSGFSAGNKVWRTVDGGATWVNISFDMPNIPVLAVVLEPGTRDITIGTDLGVFTLRHGTTSWSPVMQGLPNVAVYDLVYDAPRSRLIAATHGRGMFALDVSMTALRGDVTGGANGIPDGQLTAIDAQAILAMVVGNAPPAGAARFPNADANCDGQVTALDALLVLRKAAGLTDAGMCVGTVR